MKRALDIAIVGYGISGIAAAIYLRRAGHRITHFERNDPPVAAGAGMLMHPAAMRQLDRLGVLPAALECGARVRRICAQNERGRSLMDFRYNDAIDGQFGLGIQRGALHRLLANADPGRDQVLAGCHVISVEPGTGHLGDAQGKRHGPFDLVVIADGAHSLLRRQVAGHQDERASSAALVGLFDDPQDIAGDRLAQFFVDTRHLAIWPVGCAAPGEPARCAIAVSISLSEAGSPRDQQQWRTVCTGFWPEMRALVDPAAGTSSLRAITYREVEVSRPCVGRVAMIGDAAHSMSPQLGTGAQLALEDADALAGALARHDDVAGALRAFAHIRLPQVRRHHLASRWLTPLFQSDSRTLGFLRDRLFATLMGSTSVKRMAAELFS